MYAAGRRGDVSVVPSPAALQPSRAEPRAPAFPIPRFPPPAEPAHVRGVVRFRCSASFSLRRRVPWRIAGWICPLPISQSQATCCIQYFHGSRPRISRRVQENDRSCVRADTCVRRSGDVRMCDGTCKAQRIGTYVVSVVHLRSGGRARARVIASSMDPSIHMCCASAKVTPPIIGAKTGASISSPSCLHVLPIRSGAALDRPCCRDVRSLVCQVTCSESMPAPFGGLRRAGVRIKLFLRARNFGASYL
jgi:hypothetical protein